MALLMFGAHVAVPFFTPYMLRDLGLDISTYAWLTAASILAKVVSLPLWHRVAATLGLRAVLTVSVLGIASIPLAWVPARSELALLGVQALSGVMWAAFEFASLQLLLGAAPRAASVEFFALSSSLNGALQLAGSLFGSLLLTSGLHYRDLFVVSGVLRALPLLLLLPAARPWLARVRLRRLLLRLVSIRPGAGVERRPMLELDETPDEVSPSRKDPPT
jgi:MFS family permease